MRTKTEIGNVSLYLFWSLLKIPRFFSFTGNCKQKIWLKQPKAASALDFSYFQHVSKLVTHDRKVPKSYDFGTFVHFFSKISAGQGVGQATDPHPDPQAEMPRCGQTVPESTPLMVLAASRLAEVVTWA